MSTQTVVVTGGAGFIGSHVCLALLGAGYAPVVVDTLEGSGGANMERLQHMLGRPLPLERVSLNDAGEVRQVLQRHRPVAVIHLAAPIGQRLLQRQNNLRMRLKVIDEQVWYGINLIQAMEATDCRTLVAASSADVYTWPLSSPSRESAPRESTDTLKHADVALEELYRLISRASPWWRIGVLRLFEVAGAHPSQWLGPSMADAAPDWIMEMAHVAAGLLPQARICGRDLPTPDGTPVRDFLHVEDAARAFVSALDSLHLFGEGFVANIGSGRPTSMLEALHTFEKVCGKRLLPRFSPQEPSAPVEAVADITLARELLGWQPRHSLQNICADTWHWHQACLERKLSV
jgi:UDP-glucose 4-epimerase